MLKPFVKYAFYFIHLLYYNYIYEILTGVFFHYDSWIFNS